MRSYSKFTWLCAAIILCACQSIPGVKVVTMPSGGVVHIKEIDKNIGDGQFIQLPSGRYTLEATKAGYRSKTTVMAVDGTASQTLKVGLGKGFAPISINSIDPEQVSVSIEGKPAGSTPLRLDLDAGDYQLLFSKKGYAPQTRQLSVVPGKAIELNPRLKKLNATCSLHITTSPAGGQIFINSRKIGNHPLHVPSLEPGTYEVHAVKQIDNVMRLKGKIRVVLGKPGRHEVVVPMKKQRLFAQRWHALSYAVRAESKRYQKERVGNPVALEIRLNSEHHKALSSVNDLAGQMNKVMRVGDRVRIVADSGQWLIWKRHHLVTPEFKAAVKAMQSAKAYAGDPWSPGTRVSWTHPEANDDFLAQIAFGIQRERNQWPHLFLRANQLGRGSVKVFRCRADGPLTILAQGGKFAWLGDSRIKVLRSDSLTMTTMPTGDHPLHISWSVPPERLLVTADRSPQFKPVFVNKKLHPREKKIIDLGVKHPVTALTRLTTGPDYKGWYRQHMEPDGPLADRIDLGKDEIGPHDTQGQYTRIWLVRFKDGATTQRQMETSYMVSGPEKKFSSDNFIRRRN
ncbi:MAG: carboxypeptidase regulatory-like domain-containing protein [Desulfobacteraceae bacterium]